MTNQFTHTPAYLKSIFIKYQLEFIPTIVTFMLLNVRPDVMTNRWLVLHDHAFLPDRELVELLTLHPLLRQVEFIGLNYVVQ